MRNIVRFSTFIVCVVAFTGFAFPQSSRAETDETARITRLLEDAPAPEKFTLVYHEITGLKGSFRWHIKGSDWWVRLHPAEIYPMDKLDHSVEYDLSGIALDQAYETVNIWVKRLRPSRSFGGMGIE